MPPTEGRAGLEGLKLGLKGGGNTARSTEEQLSGVMPVLEMKLSAQLKCIYTTAYSMGNKHGKATVHQETGIEVANTKTWCMALTTGVLQ